MSQQRPRILSGSRGPTAYRPARDTLRCMSNYIRRTVLCEGGVISEGIRHSVKVVGDTFRVRHDWSVIWDEVEGNESYYQEHNNKVEADTSLTVRVIVLSHDLLSHLRILLGCTSCC